MTTTPCKFCAANDAAFAARQTFGHGSPEHRKALAAIDFEAARLGRAHDAGCEFAVETPLVVLK